MDPVAGALEYVSSEAAFRRLCDHIFAYRVQHTRRSLLHGDLWPGNILWVNDRLAAVLDWEDAAIDPAASDVACCRAELNVAFGEAAARAFTSYYLTAFPDGQQDLPLWDVYVSAAALATLHSWGLAPEIEAHRRQRTDAFFNQTVESLLRS